MTNNATIKPLYFIHVPKTAGTSFRNGLADYFGQDRGCCDYGDDSSVTSEIIKQHMYADVDMWKMDQAFRANDFQFMAGHYGLLKYLHLFGIRNSIAFVRDPLQRLLSEYRHFRDIQGYEKSLADFIQENRFQNRQHRLLTCSQLALAGFVGLTETYSESLQYINRTYGLEIPLMSKNTYRKNLDDVHKGEPEIEAQIRHLNPLDYEIYEQAKQLQDIRFSLEERELPYTRGQIVSIVKKGLNAWAVRDQDDEPVTLSVRVNNEEIVQRRAVDIRPHLAAFKTGRGGHIGMFVKLPKLREGDMVCCVAADTEQVLLGSPFKVEASHL